MKQQVGVIQFVTDIEGIVRRVSYVLEIGVCGMTTV